MIDRVIWECVIEGMLFRAFRRGFNQLPLQSHYINRLKTEASMTEEQATEFFNAIDHAVRTSLTDRNLVTRQAEGTVLGSIHADLNHSINQILADEKASIEAMQRDYDAILKEATRVKAELLEDSRRLASSLQLDINFEKKRLSEATERLKIECDQVDEYAEQVMKKEEVYLDEFATWKQLRTCLLKLLVNFNIRK